ncbi:nucleotidyl transferase AbiEii/AbiGii toxin family protein [Flavobacterium caeni]|uniref:Nucleotidyl transferase AbiEii toxin, Type IV TA system n=1 Tax=Flavobacterium caeni TaxID=490189 RepID=A0A1G5K7E6_9FLAO|nr:nucleotidyl transferase AbiEii/AbiGii toxin family protein [Flavobacterium caeni]SCY96171.1 Nucleotidyl transferase AbiEii toxin, Type IV TA system [Flavobacterium caeni]
MITPESRSEKWIRTLKQKLSKRADPKLIEKVINALVFLEELKIHGLDFIFKGGTALLLATKVPKRFSIDIDIITQQTPKEITTVLEAIVKKGTFIRWEDDNDRKHTPDAPIGHYKVYYKSKIDNEVEEPILLDLLYTPNPYPQLMQVPITHDWLDTSGVVTTINMPTFEAILGDKLTAFAPKTTGILYAKDRPVEIVKQLYDIAFLFDNITALNIVRTSYNQVVQEEIGFRKLTVAAIDVMNDTQEACYTLSERNEKSAEFQHLFIGIRNFANFTIMPFRIEEAIVAAAKVAYLIELLKDDTATVIEHYTNASAIKDWMIGNQQYNKINKLKKTNPEAFYYWYKALDFSNKI